MAFRNICVLLAVVLCATLVLAHSERQRQERSVSNFLKKAGNKIKSVFNNVKDGVRSSIETVVKYASKVENVALDAATGLLGKFGVKADLRAIVDLFKSNVKACFKNDSIRQQAIGVKDNLLTCVAKEVTAIKGLLEKASSLWETAQKLPQVMEEVSEQCKSHLDGATAATEALPDAADADDDDHDLAADAKETLEEAKQVLSKRALWDLERAMRCVKSVYSITKSDMSTIPGEIMTAAGQAFTLLQGAKGTAPACIAAKLTTSIPTLKNILVDFGKCSLQGVKEKAIAEFSGSVKAIVDAAPKIAAAAA